MRKIHLLLMIIAAMVFCSGFAYAKNKNLGKGQVMAEDEEAQTRPNPNTIVGHIAKEEEEAQSRTKLDGTKDHIIVPDEEEEEAGMSPKTNLGHSIVAAEEEEAQTIPTPAFQNKTIKKKVMNINPQQ